MKTAGRVLAVLLTASSCLSVRWSAAERYVVIPESATDGFLEPGVTQLQECMDRFGAPLLVYERPDNGFAIAYGWDDERNLGAQISYPLAEFVSASVDYEDSNRKLFGLVFFFATDGTLERWRRGYLRDILPSERPRPTGVDEIEG